MCIRMHEHLTCKYKFIIGSTQKIHMRMQSSMLLNQKSKQHFKLSKTSLNMKNVKHKDPKTHTHTKQV